MARSLLRQVIDPEIGVNIIDLGLVYRIEPQPEQLLIDMTMTSPACPMGEMILDEVEFALTHGLRAAAPHPCQSGMGAGLVAGTDERGQPPSLRLAGMSPAQALRPPWLALAALALFSGALAGLARLGWTTPAYAAALAGQHSALMIGAFFGCVISLERAVALKRNWALLAPAGAGLAGLSLIAGLPPAAAPLLLTLAAAVLLAGGLLVAAAAYRLHRDAGRRRAVLAARQSGLAAGRRCAAGDSLVAGLPGADHCRRAAGADPVAAAVRVGAARLRAGGLGLCAAAALSLWSPDAGLRLYAAALLALAAWLLRHDIARRNARQRGLTRYIAIALLCGYGWLAVAGALGLAGALLPGHPWRDAALHALGLGFVFSMVFGHAPIIIPALTRLKLPYSPAFYAPLAACICPCCCGWAACWTAASPGAARPAC